MRLPCGILVQIQTPCPTRRIRIIDADTATFSLSAPSLVNEGENIAITVTVLPENECLIPFPLQPEITPAGAVEVLRDAATQAVVFPACAAAITVTFKTIADAAPQLPRTLVFPLLVGPGHDPRVRLPSPNEVRVVVEDPAVVFVTTWRTTAANALITLTNTPVTAGRYTVAWGDGTDNTYDCSAREACNATHVYAIAGVYQVAVLGMGFQNIVADIPAGNAAEAGFDRPMGDSSVDIDDGSVQERPSRDVRRHRHAGFVACDQHPQHVRGRCGVFQRS